MESKPQKTERSLDFEEALLKKEFPTTDIETLPRSGFLERLFNSSDQNGNFRKVTLSGFLECNEEAKFVVVIAKFISILGINIRQMPCLSRLSAKQQAYIQDYNLESILADTNRKLFYKFFSKTLCPTISLSPFLFSIESGIAIFIGDQEDPKQKGIIKIMNFEGFLHSILNNVKLGEGLDQFSKFLDSRYKRLGTIICYQRLKNKTVKSQILGLLLKKFRQVVHICLYQNQLEIADEVESRIIFQSHKIVISTSQNYQISSTNSFSPKAHESIFQYYNRHTKIDSFIHKLLDRSKMERQVFNENQICITYFGVLYNYLSLNWKPKITMEQVEEAFLKKLIQEKIEFGDGTKKQKKILTRKLGHYPIKIEKGSKVCCVCDDAKKKKTRFRCEKCSDTFSRDIAICIGHFKQFHSNVHKYIPKGVRKGAYENELQMFKQQQNNSLGPSSGKNNQVNDLTSNYERIMKKWTTNFIDGELQMGILGSYLSDQRMQKFYPPQFMPYYPHPQMHFPPFYPEPHMFEFKEDPHHEFVPHFLNNIVEHPENKITMQKYEPGYEAKIEQQ